MPLTPVDYDPFKEEKQSSKKLTKKQKAKLVPVDYDPFASEKKQPEISAEKGIPQYLIPFSKYLGIEPTYVKPGSFLGNLLAVPHAFFEAGTTAFESPYYILKGLGKILRLPSLEKAGEWGIKGLEPTRRHHELMRKQLYVPPTSPTARLAHSISKKVAEAIGSFARPDLPVLVASPTAYGFLSGLETLGAGAPPTQALTAGIHGMIAGKTFEAVRGLSPMQALTRAGAVGATPEVARGLITGKPEQIGKGIEEGLSLGIFSALATIKTPLAREIYRNKVKAGVPREKALQTASLVEETIKSLDIDKAKSLPLKEKEIQKVEKIIREISKQIEDLPEVIKGKRGYKTEKGAKIGLRLFAKENKLPKDMDLTQHYNLEKDEAGNFVWRKITEKPTEIKPAIKPKEEVKPPEVEIPKEEKPPAKEIKEKVEEKPKKAKPYESVEPGSAEWMKIWKEHPELQKEMAEIRQKQIVEEGKKEEALPEAKPEKEPPKEKPPVVPLTKTLYENSYPIELSKASEVFPKHRLGVDYVVKLVDKNTGKVTWASLSEKRARELFPRSFEEKAKEVPKAEAEWQPVKDYSKEITEGTHVKWKYKGKEGEGIATGKTGRRKTGFVYHKVKTPEGKTKYMPWTPKAEYWIKAEKKVKPVKETKAEVKEKEPIIAISKREPNLQFEIDRIEGNKFIVKRPVIISTLKGEEGKIVETPDKYLIGREYPVENFRFVTPKEYVAEVKTKEAKIKAEREAQRETERKKQEEIKQALKAKPVTDKYYIYLKDKGFEEVEKAYPVKISGFEKYDLFAHKVGKKWKVSESKTGVAITKALPTRKEAIKQATEILNRHKEKSDEMIEDAIAYALSQTGISPRYKPISKEPTITQPKENLYEVRHPEKKTWYQIKEDPETEQWRVIKFEPYETIHEGQKVTVNKATETKFFKTLEEAKDFAQKGIIGKPVEVKISSFVKDAYLEEYGKEKGTQELSNLKNKVQKAWDILKKKYPQYANKITSITIHRMSPEDIALGGVSSIGKKGDVIVDPTHAKTEPMETLAHEMLHATGATEKEARAFEKTISKETKFYSGIPIDEIVKTVNETTKKVVDYIKQKKIEKVDKAEIEHTDRFLSFYAKQIPKVLTRLYEKEHLKTAHPETVYREALGELPTTMPEKVKKPIVNALDASREHDYKLSGYEIKVKEKLLGSYNAIYKIYGKKGIKRFFDLLSAEAHKRHAISEKQLKELPPEFQLAYKRTKEYLLNPLKEYMKFLEEKYPEGYKTEEMAKKALAEVAEKKQIENIESLYTLKQNKANLFYWEKNPNAEKIAKKKLPQIITKWNKEYQKVKELLKQAEKDYFYQPTVRTHEDIILVLKKPKKEGAKSTVVGAFEFPNERKAKQQYNRMLKGDYTAILNWFRRVGDLEAGRDFVNNIKKGDYTLKLIKFKTEPTYTPEDIPLQSVMGILSKYKGKQIKAKNLQAKAIAEDIQRFIEKFVNPISVKSFHLEKKNIPGWSLDPLDRNDILLRRVLSEKSLIEKLKLSDVITNSFAQIDPEQHPQYYKWLSDFNKYMMTPREPETTRRILSAWSMWGNAMSVIANATQSYILGPAVIIENKLNPAKFLKYETEYLRKYIESDYDSKDLAYLEWGKKNGVFAPTAWKEAMLGLTGERGGVIPKIEDIGYAGFTFVESVKNRMNTFLSVAKMLEEKGMPFEEAMKKARDITFDIHFDMNKWNTLIRKKYPRLFQTLMSFTFHSFKTLRRLIFKSFPSARERKYAIGALATFYLTHFLVGGMAATPGGELFWQMVDIPFKKVFRQSIKTYLMNEFSDKERKKLRLFIQYGLLGLAGLPSVADRIGFGYREVSKLNNFIADAMAHLAPIPVMVANQAVKAIRMTQKGYSWPTAISQQFSPTVVRNISRTLYAIKKGYLPTSYGKPLQDIYGNNFVPTGLEEIAMSFIGAIPPEQQEIYEIKEAQRKKEDIRLAHLHDITNDIVLGYLDKDYARIGRGFAKWTKYNKEIIKKIIKAKKEKRNDLARFWSTQLIEQKAVETSIRNRLGRHESAPNLLMMSWWKKGQKGYEEAVKVILLREYLRRLKQRLRR
ncbi:MAG: hypothetical protein ACTSSF_00015 [Candidatus Heimdallarchaeaceae archaeon]